MASIAAEIVCRLKCRISPDSGIGLATAALNNPATGLIPVNGSAHNDRAGASGVVRLLSRKPDISE